MKITKQYLMAEMVKFREIMGNRTFTVEQTADALQGLLFCYYRYIPENKKDKDQISISMAAITKEYDMRLGYRVMLGI